MQAAGADLMHLLLPDDDGVDVLLRVHLPLPEAAAQEPDRPPLHPASVCGRHHSQSSAAGQRRLQK